MRRMRHTLIALTIVLATGGCRGVAPPTASPTTSPAAPASAPTPNLHIAFFSNGPAYISENYDVFDRRVPIRITIDGKVAADGMFEPESHTPATFHLALSPGLHAVTVEVPGAASRTFGVATHTPVYADLNFSWNRYDGLKPTP